MDLLEREPALRTLQAAWQAVLAGEGRVALVSGEAGIGKTSLLERFTAAQGSAGRVLWGACDALFTPRPLGPLHDMAPHMGAALRALLRSDANRGALFAAVLAEFQRPPTLAVFEDIHWADDATLDLLKFLGRRITRTRALLVLTYRDDELDATHPLRRLLGDLATSPAFVRVPLAPLSEAAVRALAGGHTVDPALLHAQTGGNPFYVTEVLSNVEGRVPATVRAAVLARVARLSPAAQSALKAAAILGPRIEPWALLELAGSAAPATNECLALGMLVAQGDLLAFRHELARATVLETIAPTLAPALHAQALRVLQAAPSTRTDLTRLAHHAEGARDAQAVLSIAPAAARQAAAAGAHREAAALYALTLQYAAAVPLEERAAWLDELSGEMHTIGQLEPCAGFRQQAIEAWRAAGHRPRESLSQSRLATVLINIGQPEAARRASQAALDLLHGLPPGPELAWAQRTRAHLLMLSRDCAEAVVWAARAAELAAAYEEPEALARAFTTLGAAQLLLGDERGEATLKQALGVAQAIGWDFGVANAYANLGSISCEMFRLDRAAVFLEEGLGYAGERDLDFLNKYLLAWQAQALLYRGEWARAQQAAGQALHGFGTTVIGRIPGLVALGRLHARRGDADPWPLLDEALALAAQSQTLQRMGLARAARAEAAWLAGEPARALAEANALYPLAVERQHPWIAGELAFWRWQAGAAEPAPAWVAPPFALHLTGHGRAAAEAWQRLGCPYEQARALADGDPPAQAEAVTIFDRLGALPAARAVRARLRTAGVRGVPRGPRAATRHNPFGLTPRQADILARLAEGRSNAEIAAALHLSPKTVDHHVSAVLAKLNVHSREEAAALVSRRPPPG